jgi:hypothetical protein
MTPFPDLAEALEILQNCFAGLREQRQMTQLRVQAVDFCRCAARLVAEALSRPLQQTEERVDVAPAASTSPRRSDSWH